MDPFTPEKLIQAIRGSGQFTSDQLAILDVLSPELLQDVPAFSETLRSEHLLTAYQHTKVKRNRISDLIIGPYLIIDKIGEGGMGKVYKAVNINTGVVVALKVVRQQLLNQGTVLKRFKREVEASSKLKHPNIVALLDASEDRGRHYLAMEFVFGSDLSRLVKEFGTLPPAEAAEYIRQAALGLQHAHDQNLVHRDIKPSNLLVSGERALPETGGVAFVRILDMGLVRSLIEEDTPDRSELTRDGTVVGTPDYMSPEQAKNSSTVDGRADIYSLGCALFFLLTGKPPFPDGSPIDKLLRHQLDPPPELRSLRPDVPVQMSALVAKMLAKEPKDRPQTANEVAKLLYPFTPEGIAKTPEIDFTMPEKKPAVPAPQPTVAPPPKPAAPGPILNAEVLDAEVVSVPKPPPKTKVAAAAVGGGTRRRPVKLVPREADSDEIITKGLTSPTSTRRAANDDSDEAPASPRTRSQDSDTTIARRRPNRAKPPAKKPVPWVPIIAGLGAFLLLTVVAAIVFQRPSDPIGPDPNANKQPVNPTPPMPPPRTVLPPAWTMIPDGAVAVIVVHPSAYWQLARDQVEPQSAYARMLNTISTKYAFDLRSGERYVVSMLPGPKLPFVTSIEGPGVNPTWAKSLEDWPSIKLQKTDGMNLLTFKHDGESQKVRGAFVPNRGYFLASEDGLLRTLAKRSSTTKPSLASEILEAIPDDADAEKPAVTFVATGEWQLPNGVRLSDLGIERVLVRAKLLDDKFHVETEVCGPSRERVSEFVNITLWNRVASEYPNVKPFLQAIAENIANDGWDKVGKLDRLKKSQPEAWSIANLHVWLDKLLDQ